MNPNKPNLTTTAERFQYLLDTNSVSCYGVWQNTKVVQSTLRDILNGSQPRKKTAKRIAEYFGVSPDWLLTGKTKRDIAVENLLGDEYKVQKGSNHPFIAIGEGFVSMVPYVERDRLESFFMRYDDKDFMSSLPYRAYVTPDVLDKEFIAIETEPKTVVYAVRYDDDAMRKAYNYLKGVFILVGRTFLLEGKCVYNEESNYYQIDGSSIPGNDVGRAYRIVERSIKV